MSDDSIIAVVAVACIFGGGTIWGVVDCCVSNWRKAKVAEANAGLKRTMVEHGYTADEILRVVGATGSKADKMVEKTV